MEYVDIVSRIIHVATAITLVGGSVFTLFVLLPSAKELPNSAHDRLATAVTGRWKRFVHLGVALFLMSGLYNYARAVPLHRGDGLYHALLGIKMLMALCIFFLAAALVGRSESLNVVRRHKETWLKILVLLAAIIVGISGFVKVRGIPSTEQAGDSQAQVGQPEAAKSNATPVE